MDNNEMWEHPDESKRRRVEQSMRDALSSRFTLVRYRTWDQWYVIPVSAKPQWDAWVRALPANDWSGEVRITVPPFARAVRFEGGGLAFSFADPHPDS